MAFVHRAHLVGELTGYRVGMDGRTRRERLRGQLIARRHRQCLRRARDLEAPGPNVRGFMQDRSLPHPWPVSHTTGNCWSR